MADRQAGTAQLKPANPSRSRRAVLGTVVLILAALLPGVAPLAPAAPAAAQTAGGGSASPGYWLVDSGGGVYALGTTNFGNTSGIKLARPIVGGAATPDGLGYWMVASDGGIFSFGDAPFDGSAGGLPLARPIVGMAVDPATGGYWLVASDGGVFSYDAPFYGSTGAVPLAKPVVGMAATPDGKGYWLVASDGGVFAFGDAGFYGSTGGIPLAKPVVGMASSPGSRGYWLVASDGGIFGFGDAGFHGSAGGLPLAAPVVGMAASADGNGYWLAAADGGVFTFGDAVYLGNSGRASGSPPIVALAETNSGYPFPPQATGYDISQYQCPQNGGSIPSSPAQVGVVQVTGGAINNPPNPCYPAEASWAGPNMSAYIFMDGLPQPAPSEAMTGPAGSCSAGDVSCESYNFGYYWARHWVAYSRGLGIKPTLWWLDVENGPGEWPCIDVNPGCNSDQTAAAQASNSRVVSGAVAGLRASGVQPGVYSTATQWGNITGNQLSFPNMALWVPGGGDISNGTYAAVNFCNGPLGGYEPFAGGVVVLVQYGYQGNGYDGPSTPYDQDYACR